MTIKSRKAMSAISHCVRAKAKRQEARTNFKKQIQVRDKEPTEKELNKYNKVDVDGKTIIEKETFKFGIFHKNGYRPIGGVNGNSLFSSREEAEKALSEIKNNQNLEIREILGW